MIPTSEESLLAINIVDLNILLPVGAVNDGLISKMAMSEARKASMSETNMRNRCCFVGSVLRDMEMHSLESGPMIVKLRSISMLKLFKQCYTPIMDKCERLTCFRVEEHFQGSSEDHAVKELAHFAHCLMTFTSNPGQEKKSCV